MRRLFTCFLFLVVVVGGLGFYLGWFGVSTSNDPNTGKTAVELTIDKNKMKSDAEKAKEKVAEGVHKVTDKKDGK